MLEWNLNSKGVAVARKDIDGNALFVAFIAVHAEHSISLTIDIRQTGTSMYKKEFRNHDETSAKESANRLYNAFYVFFIEKNKKQYSDNTGVETPELVHALRQRLMNE